MSVIGFVDGRIVRQERVGAVHPNRLRAIEVNRPYLSRDGWSPAKS